MTVRTAELLMAIATIVISIALMIKSAENHIGWVAGRGPGAGFWPFWLATVMMLASVWTLVRWFMRVTPESRNLEAFIARDSMPIVFVTVAALIFLVGASHIIGLYFALLVFLFFYMKAVGGHSWMLTIILSVATPVFIFLLFEWALSIPLPKGYSEPLFYPIYDLMY